MKNVSLMVVIAVNPMMEAGMIGVVNVNVKVPQLVESQLLKVWYKRFCFCFSGRLHMNEGKWVPKGV